MKAVDTSHILGYGIGIIGVLVAFISYLRSSNKDKDQQISGLKSVASLAESILKAAESKKQSDEFEKEANESQKAYESIRDKLLSSDHSGGDTDV